MSQAPSFTPLGADDLDGLRALVGDCVAHDGGLPFSAEAEFVGRCFLAGPGVAVREGGGTVVAAVAIAVSPTGSVAVSGAVHPSRRRRGLGTSLLCWALAEAGDRDVQLRSESVTEDFCDLAAGSGFAQVFGELVMFRAVTPGIDASLAAGLEARPWSDDAADTFFAAYNASFSSRPGFPGWSKQEWVDGLTGEPGFDADASVVVVDAGGDPAGFVMIDGEWIEQLGVAPAHRHQGLATELLRRAVEAIGARGNDAAWLCVNENNPEARALYESLGFATFGRRGRFERSAAS